MIVRVTYEGSCGPEVVKWEGRDAVDEYLRIQAKSGSDLILRLDDETFIPFVRIYTFYMDAEAQAYAAP